jgi:hypothetical protein
MVRVRGHIGVGQKYFQPRAALSHIASVMPRPVLHEGNERPRIRAVRERALRIGRSRPGRLPESVPHGLADEVYEREILDLGATTDIVSFAGCAAPEDQGDAPTMIVDVEPVPHIASVAVNRERSSMEDVDNGQRNELLREVIRSVIVRAVTDGAISP